MKKCGLRWLRGWQQLALWLGLLAVLAVPASLARAEPDDLNPTLPSEMQAPFALTVNHAEKGEINVLLRDGQPFVKRADLIEAGIRVPAGVEVESGGEKFLSLASVSPPLSYELDENEIKLSIVAPTNLLPNTAVDLGGRPPEVVYDRHASGFFNYAPRVNEQGRVDLYEEMGASVGGNLLFSSAYLSSAHHPVRGVSNFVIDDRADLRRTTFGDALVTTGPLGSGSFVGGVTVARAFELDPYTVKAPSLGYVGSTMTPATVDVYVNGARVRSEEIQPGTFRLDNLRVGGGAGVATYVIRDVFGHEQSVVAPFYIADNVLKRGLQQYTYSAGVLRNAVSTSSWNYGEGAVLGTHRIGITDHLTLGARAEASNPVISGGPSLAAMTGIGQVELELAASRDTTGGTGFAGFLSYGFVSRRFGAGAFGRLMTDHYSTINTRSATDRATTEVGVYQSLPLGSRFTFSTQAALSNYRDRGLNLRGSAQVAMRIATRATLFLSGTKTRNEDGTAPWEVLLTFNMSLEGGHNTSATGRLTNNGPGLLLDANKSLPVGEGYGYRANAAIAERKSASALVQYQTLFGRYGAQYDYYDHTNHASLDAAGAIAIVPGVGVFPTLPVQDGFGVIRVAGVKNVRGYVNNQELGTTDRNGNLLVPHLLSYYGNRLGIAQQDVPIQYGIQTTEMTLAPPSRGVAVADFPLTIPHFYRGRLVVDEHGKRVVPKYGQVRVVVPAMKTLTKAPAKHPAKPAAPETEELISPLGEEGEFELDGIEPGPRHLTIDYANGTCGFDLNIVDTDSTIVDLGEIVCKVPLPAAPVAPEAPIAPAAPIVPPAAPPAAAPQAP